MGAVDGIAPCGVVVPVRVNGGLGGGEPAGDGRAVVTASKIGGNWTPRELRHSFVSLLSAERVPVESISQLVSHASTTVTETVLPP